MTIRHALLTACTFAAFTVGGISAASAQLEPTAAEATAMGGPELNNILLTPGRLEVRAPLAIGMSSGAAGKPLSIPLDVYYGINENLTLGLTHSEGTVQAVMPYRPGHGICLSGKENGCFKVYNNLGVDALFSLMKGVMQLAFHGGLDFRSINPNYLALRVGLLFQAPLAANLAIITDPRLGIGLTKRDFNKEYLTLPLAVQFWLSPMTRLAVRTAIAGPLDGFGDAYAGLLGAFIGLGLTDMVEGFASFDFTNLYGTNGSGDYRSLVIGVNFRM